MQIFPKNGECAKRSETIVLTSPSAQSWASRSIIGPTTAHDGKRSTIASWPPRALRDFERLRPGHAPFFHPAGAQSMLGVVVLSPERRLRKEQAVG